MASHLADFAGQVLESQLKLPERVSSLFIRYCHLFALVLRTKNANFTLRKR